MYVLLTLGTHESLILRIYYISQLLTEKEVQYIID